MGLLLTLHSINRWFIIIFALLAIIMLVKDILARTEASKNSKIYSSIFTGLMDLQLVLGGAAFMLPDMSDGGRHMHMGVMILAIIVAHLPAVFKKRNPAIYPKVMLGAIIVALALVIYGVSALGGQDRWLHVWGIF